MREERQMSKNTRQTEGMLSRNLPDARIGD